MQTTCLQRASLVFTLALATVFLFGCCSARAVVGQNASARIHNVFAAFPASFSAGWGVDSSGRPSSRALAGGSASAEGVGGAAALWQAEAAGSAVPRSAQVAGSAETQEGGAVKYAGRRVSSLAGVAVAGSQMKGRGPADGLSPRGSGGTSGGTTRAARNAQRRRRGTGKHKTRAGAKKTGRKTGSKAGKKNQAQDSLFPWVGKPQMVVLDSTKKGRCLDGSSPAFVIRRGYGTGLNKWIFYLEGGGWCFSVKQCLVRSRTLLGSSRFYNQTGDNIDLNGIASSDIKVNPGFHNWNFVIFKYCDGAAFAGNRGVVRPRNVNSNKPPVYMEGRWNLLGIIEALLAKHRLGQATDVLLTGCSAGGQGVSMACDGVAKWMAQFGAKTRCLMDAGFFMDIPTIRGAYVFRRRMDQLASTGGLARGSYDQECAAAFRGSRQQWKCTFPEYNLHFVSTPTFILNSNIDYKAISMTLIGTSRPSTHPLMDCYYSSGLSECTSQQRGVIGGYATRVMGTVQEVVRSAQRRGAAFTSFIYQTKSHCMVGDPTWQSVVSPQWPGKNLPWAISEWYYGAAVAAKLHRRV
ncbi:hypothetical protein CLOM_g12391 [Closterium sp. NIES-68]|nr:hypothetical protein CLOM_g12391 [Closterium sp. NIES-68]GJP82846.1 hypothetical protein CLOP_g13073 [Closterium sp. NIES-67]